MKIRNCIIVLLIMSSIIFVGCTEQAPTLYASDTMEILVFGIGRSDSILITTDNYVMMIDTGERQHGRLIADYLLEQNINTIDYLIITHFDSDHVGEWYLVEQRVRLNTPGQSDGIMQLWINEKLVVERTDLNFRGWNIEAGITRIQLEVYANSPRGATVDASRYISHLVVSTEYIGPAVFVPSSPLDDARRELRTILVAEIGSNFASPVFVLDENAYTACSWLEYAAAINAAIIVYNTSYDISAIRAAGQLVLSAKAALVEREVILVELTPTGDWLFWQDFDGNTGGVGSLQVQGLGYIAEGAGIGGSRALQSTMQPGDTARISFPAQDVAYIRFYTRSNVTDVGGGAFWARAYHNQNWGANAIRLNVNGNGSIEINAGPILPGTIGVFSSTEWIGVELRFDMVERTITTWVDGRLQGAVPIPAAVTAAQFASFQFHNFTGFGSGTRYYDNFVVSTSYIGPMSRVFADGGDVPDPREGWLFWENFDGDSGGTAASLGSGGEIGAFGITGRGLRNTITDNTTPLTIQFPAQEVVYVRFDVRSEITGVENDSFWARVHNGQYWGVNAFRINVWANGSISSMGRPIVANTANALTSDSWVCIEMRFDIPAGQKTIWIDGELAGVGYLQPDRTITQISRFQLHTFDRAGTGYRFYDNFVVSTSRIGARPPLV